MASFTQTYEINAPVEVVWRALTDPDVIDEWGAGPAVMDDRVGTEFELWGGDIWGKNIAVKKNGLLQQEWYAGEWDQPSVVTFALKKKGKMTDVVLTHENMPENEKESLEQGWSDYYFLPLKDLIEKTHLKAESKKKKKE